MADGRIIDVDSLAGTAALKRWTDQECSPPPVSPFQRHDVMLALHAIHTPDRRLAFAVGSEGEGASSFLPFSVTRRTVGGVPFRLIGGPVGYHASVVDFAVSGGESSDQAAASALLASSGWDLLEFRGVAADSTLARAFAMTGCAIIDDHDAHAIPLDDGAVMSAKRARNQRRLRRRMAEETGTEVVTMTPLDPDWPAVIEAFAVLHRARWQDTGTPSAFADPATRERLAAQFGGAAAPPGLRAVTLTSGGHIRGVVLAFDHGDEVHAWRLAYDVTLAPYSPGLQLLQGLAESAAAEGRSLLRLGRGDDEYKQSWATIRIPQVIVRGVSSSARVRLTGMLARVVGRTPFASWQA
ncbi:MAG: GNAT family N-acetyltransferase [Gemmatimonadota bacterium]